ncbi:hypothetical protein [Nocardioides solisilvae]|uniref:hypothetical protein n=1 Tax=Nocardioides solisilvae TaxID=1542435 RepID=UPI0013A54000|nr:hypothetical protein [Nocardioides solisilvae]
MTRASAGPVEVTYRAGVSQRYEVADADGRTLATGARRRTAPRETLLLRAVGLLAHLLD